MVFVVVVAVAEPTFELVEAAGILPVQPISNSIRTEQSPIQSVSVWVIPKLDNCTVQVKFVYHRPVWLQTELDNMKSYYQLIIKITISEKRRWAMV